MKRLQVTEYNVVVWTRCCVRGSRNRESEDRVRPYGRFLKIIVDIKYGKWGAYLEGSKYDRVPRIADVFWLESI